MCARRVVFRLGMGKQYMIVIGDENGMELIMGKSFFLQILRATLAHRHPITDAGPDL